SRSGDAPHPGYRHHGLGDDPRPNAHHGRRVRWLPGQADQRQATAGDGTRDSRQTVALAATGSVYFAYSNLGASFRASFVTPGRTILPICCLNLDTGTATLCSPIPRNPPTPTIAYESERSGVTIRSLMSPIFSPESLYTSFPRICFLALHPFATCRISEVDTSTDPAVCAEESATLIPTMTPISATRAIALMFASLGSSRPSVYLVRRGTLGANDTTPVLGTVELNLGSKREPGCVRHPSAQAPCRRRLEGRLQRAVAIAESAFTPAHPEFAALRCCAQISGAFLARLGSTGGHSGSCAPHSGPPIPG